jgi:UDP-GlcNAc:undecaprenyl-phosphate GlcNAc-1-phosphate transferase
MTFIPDLGDFFISNVGDFVGPIVVVFILAALIALAVTPVVRRVMMRYEIVDRPEARRVNTIPVPRGGGLAVCGAFLLVSALFLIVNQTAGIVPIPFSLDSSEVVALLLGSALAAGFGAIDDLLDLRARYQLVGQVALAGAAVVLGVSITVVTNPFGPDFLFTGPVAAALTIFWIVGMINSINWIDGLDGLSSGVAFIAAVTLGIISLTTQVVAQPLIAVLCFALA